MISWRHPWRDDRSRTNRQLTIIRAVDGSWAYRSSLQKIPVLGYHICRNVRAGTKLVRIRLGLRQAEQ